MAIKFVDSLAKRKASDALILPFFEGKVPAFGLNKGISGLYEAPLKSGDFRGENGAVLCHYPMEGGEKRVVLVGLGKEDSLTKETLRRAYASAIGSVKSKAKSVNVLIPEKSSLEAKAVSEAIVEGVLLSNYVYDVNKTQKDKAIEEISFIGGELKAMKRAETICSSVCYTRDMIFANADTVTPAFLADKAKELSAEHASVKTTILNREQIKKQKLGLLEAVSRGSDREPALVIMEYRGAPKSKECVAIVGKGISFDTGGLNIKTVNMETMRDDMSGAGAVLGTIRNMALLKLPINVIGVLAAAENAIGPNSYKPGDVYKGYSGITVEVTNTDAEGRLVLADALSYVQKKFAPSKIVDLGTLTGGCIIALGEEVSALMSNNDQLAQELFEAGEETYERLWRLPLYDEYNQLLKSKVADTKNVGIRKASTIQCGMFLKKFIEKGSWAHIDIAGTASPDDLKPYQPVQAAGVGVRLLTTFLERCV
ncbi:MAG: leucyl aminopeptidase [Verrucomicrobia bacterium]|nr:leucyl aminopeptidase [Verrucomicrobiota bacterium]